MARSFELLLRRERLLVGQRFLEWRPLIVSFGAVANAWIAVHSGAPESQRRLLAVTFAVALGAFWLEAWWLRRHALSERWLRVSLSLTLLALGFGALVSGGLRSPLLPLSLTPVVIGFAAFARSRTSALLFGVAATTLAVLALAAPAEFPPPPSPAAERMAFVSTLMALALAAVGVIGLVDAHARVARELERMRKDVLAEAERRAVSVEHLGARVAHEVKNPLTAVRGLVQLVLRKSTEPKDRERLEVVLQELDRALEVLRDYLSFSRPLTDLALAEVSARTLLEEVAAVLEARAQDRQVQLSVESDASTLLADRARLRDAVLNLALNAIEAMPNGGALRLRARTDGPATTITVEDDGVGMAPELVQRLGRPFTSESPGGTGLGVLSARAVASQHGGNLHFESQPGRGTRAELRLPHPRD